MEDRRGHFFCIPINEQLCLLPTNLYLKMKMRKFIIFTFSIIFLASCAVSEERRMVIKENRYYQCEPSPTIKKKMLKLINQLRTSSRRCGNKTFPPAGMVRWNERLAVAAMDQARDMAMGDMLSHTGSDGSSVGGRVEKKGYDWQNVAENIAAGRQTSEEVVSLWVGSPGHCANLMKREIREIGAACSRNPETRYGTYWTLVMAAPLLR
jgi:uncharacterized protein YkwD